MYTASHKGSDLPRGSQIITRSHIVALLVQGHLEGLGFVVLLQHKHYVTFYLFIYFFYRSCPMTIIRLLF